MWKRKQALNWRHNKQNSAVCEGGLKGKTWRITSTNWLFRRMNFSFVSVLALFLSLQDVFRPLTQHQRGRINAPLKQLRRRKATQHFRVFLSLSLMKKSSAFFSLILFFTNLFHQSHRGRPFARINVIIASKFVYNNMRVEDRQTMKEDDKVEKKKCWVSAKSDHHVLNASFKFQQTEIHNTKIVHSSRIIYLISLLSFVFQLGAAGLPESDYVIFDILYFIFYFISQNNLGGEFMCN